MWTYFGLISSFIFHSLTTKNLWVADVRSKFKIVFLKIGLKVSIKIYVPDHFFQGDELLTVITKCFSTQNQQRFKI